MIKEREKVTEETGRILELLDKENVNKEQFDKLELGPNFESILEGRCYCREMGCSQDREARNESACLKRAEGDEMEAAMCHFCVSVRRKQKVSSEERVQS